MAWVYVKQKDRSKVHYITEEAYQSIFKDMGFEIVSNPENTNATTEEQVGNKNVPLAIAKPIKRQYNKQTKGGK